MDCIAFAGGLARGIDAGSKDIHTHNSILGLNSIAQ
jgi:hypothetical protein